MQERTVGKESTVEKESAVVKLSTNEGKANTELGYVAHQGAEYVAHQGAEGARNAVHQGSEMGNPRHHPYMPMPDPLTGELKIDPEIVLKAKGFNLAISFFYSNKSNLNAEFGRSRSLSVAGHILSSVSSNVVTIVRGDLSAALFGRVGTGYMPAEGIGTVSTLTFDGTNFLEAFPDGMSMKYGAQVGGGDPVKHELVLVSNATGVAQT